MKIVIVTVQLLAVINAVESLFAAENQVLSTCALAVGFTGIITHLLQEENRSTEEAVQSITNTDPCAGNECGGNGQCIPAFCDCQSGFCGPTCQRSDQETGSACPCQLKFSLCVENTCVCDCGFTYNQTLDLCLKDCEQGFDDTFTLFDGKRINANPFDAFVPVPGGSLQETRDACNDACIQEPACRSYGVFNTDIFRCFLYTVSKEDVGLVDTNNFEAYERNCIGEMS